MLTKLIVAAMGVSLAAADQVNLLYCQNTNPRLPLNTYNLMAVR